MSEKLLYEIEMAFLKQIYEHKGAIGVNELLHVFQSSYGLKEDMFNRILGVVMQQEYCIIEKIRKLDNTEEEVIFITYKGLEKLSEKKNFSVNKMLKNQVAYELKCEGYKTFSDWLDANRNQLALEAEVTRMFARVLADMCIILMNKDNDDEIKETLQAATARMSERTKRFPELNNSVAYTIVSAIYDKLLNLLGNDRYIYEVEMTVKLIESYMPERHDMAIDFI